MNQSSEIFWENLRALDLVLKKGLYSPQWENQENRL